MRNKKNVRKSRGLSAEALECRRLMAVDVQQLANINRANPWASVELITEINGQAYLTAHEPADAYRVNLWVTDGTQAGTTRLTGPIDYVSTFANVGGTFYFNGEDAEHGRELWKSDGTAAGTVMVRDFTPGPDNSYIDSLVNLNGQLLFSNSGELSRSDGTPAGTFHVKDLRAGNDGVGNITLVDSNTAYFTGWHKSVGQSLYKTDGTMAGTVLVEDAQELRDLENVNGTLFFVEDGDVRKQSGNSASELVKSGGNPHELTNVGGTLFFSSAGGGIWKSDGSAAGTELLGSAGNAFNLVNMNDRLYFTGGVEFMGDGYELWTSDGTAGGTMMVKDIDPGFSYRPGYGYEGPEYIGPYGDSSRPEHFTNLNGTVYFLAGVGDKQLWTTDGTEVGTVKVQDGDFTSLLSRNGTLLLAGALPQTEGINLYNSDGTEDDATLIPRLGLGTGSSDPSEVVEVNGTLYLTADDGIHGRELWKVESGVASLVKDIAPGLPGSTIRNLTNFQGKLYFVSGHEGALDKLWISDGTSDGTVPVRDDVVVGSANLAVVADELFFAGVVLPDDTGIELWKTDGSAAGTVLVKNIRAGHDSSAPRYLVNVNGTLFFAAAGSDGGEVWQSDGTQAGTTQVADLNPGSSSSYPRDLTNVNGTLFFVASKQVGDESEEGLWKTDGTADGTVLVKGAAQGLTSTTSLAVVGNTLYFVGRNEDDVRGLWKTDGTTLGTAQVKTASGIAELTNVDGKLYFVAISGTVPVLWRSDGSEAGTQPVGGAGFGPANLTNLDGALFYSADLRDSADNGLGRELAEITNSGSIEIYDLTPGPTSSDPGALSVAGGKLYFAASGAKGRELWRALSPAAPPNDAPVLDASLNPALASIPEDVKTPKSTLVSSLLAGAVSDADAGARRGIAVTTASSFNGTWQYSINGGKTWQDMGSVSQAAAKLLPGWARLRFIPKTDFNGTVKLFYRAWDQTSGSPGGTLSVPGNTGGTKSLSTAYEGASLTVTPVNDPPKLSLGGTLSYVHDSPAVSLAPGGLVSDIDSSNFGGGRLSVRVTDGADASNRLSIGAGFSVDRNGTVFQGTTIIGIRRESTNGVGTKALAIQFPRDATAAVVQKLLRAITFKTIGGAAGQRKVVFTLNDGDGGVSDAAVKLVNVT